MQEIITALLEVLETHIRSDEVKKEIYREFIPVLIMYDEDLNDDVAKENDLFAEVYHEFHQEASEEYLDEE